MHVSLRSLLHSDGRSASEPKLIDWKRELLWTLLIAFGVSLCLLLILGIERFFFVKLAVISFTGAVLGIRWARKIQRFRNSDADTVE